MSNSVSGLSDEHRAHARKLILKACLAMVRNKHRINYTQGPRRWEGIAKRLTITKDQYPKYSDCSSSSQWLLWDAMARPYGVRDLVSRSNWAFGYTGSQYKNGKAVKYDKNIKVGDLIFYGDQGGGVPKHVCVSVGGRRVFSHGSQGGPYILDLDYRGDRRMTRRYI